MERRNEHEWFDDMHELAVPYNCLTVITAPPNCTPNAPCSQRHLGCSKAPQDGAHRNNAHVGGM